MKILTVIMAILLVFGCVRVMLNVDEPLTLSRFMAIVRTTYIDDLTSWWDGIYDSMLDFLFYDFDVTALPDFEENVDFIAFMRNAWKAIEWFISSIFFGVVTGFHLIVQGSLYAVQAIIFITRVFMLLIGFTPSPTT